MTWVIIISHSRFLEGTVLWKYHLNANIAVNYFFMLSGFGLYYSNYSANRAELFPTNGIKFSINKIKKIYRLYIASLLLCSIHVFFDRMSRMSLFGAIKNTILNLLIDIPLVQSLSGINSIGHSINPVAWFLSALFICYMFCPFFYKIIFNIKNLKKILILIVFNIFLIMMLTTVLATIKNNILINKKIIFDKLDYSTPYLRVFFVSLGMLLSKLFVNLQRMLDKKTKNKMLFTIIEVATVIGAICWSILRNYFTSNSISSLLLDVLFPTVLLLIFAFQNGFISRLLTTKKLVFLGKQCMYPYLLQYVGIYYISDLVNKFHLQISPYMQMVMVILFILLLSVFMEKLFLYLEKTKCVNNK